MLRQLGMVLAHGYPFFDRIKEFDLARAEFITVVPSEKASLEKLVSSTDIVFSAHCPMIVPENYLENPLLASVLDFDEERRKLGVSLMLNTMEYAADLGAEYMVVHMQRPEHFGGENPAGVSTSLSREIASRSLETLSEASSRFHMPVLIENLMDNRAFNRAESYLELLERFPDIGFCLDIGHLDVDARMFGFSFDEFIDALIPHLKAVHLQNSNTARSDFGQRHWKIPVNPEQAAGTGWLDIEAILRGILSKNRDCVVNLEARLDEEHDHAYMSEGVYWIKEMLTRILFDFDNEK